MPPRIAAAAGSLRSFKKCPLLALLPVASIASDQSATRNTVSRQLHRRHCSSLSMEKFSAARRLGQLRQNVWEIFSQLSRDHKPVHLGSGFPDLPPPELIAEALRTAAADPKVHQMTSSWGHPRLVSALRTLYSKELGRDLSSRNVLVTIGAYEALFDAFMGLLNEGDEVILIEPFFDCYEAMIRMANAVPRFATLRPDPTGEWLLDMEELRSKFSVRTKMIVVNTPHNPLGKVFTESELLDIANLCREFDVVALMDEVYERTVFKGCHVRMACLPGMWERTITVGSAGKSFSVTGWHTGWAYGPENLMEALRRVHEHAVNSCPTFIQEALAIATEEEIRVMGSADSFWSELPRLLESRKEKTCSILARAGFQVFEPKAGYFVVVDFEKYPEKPSSLRVCGEAEDLSFAKWLCVEKKVLAIPPSAFYSEPNVHEAKSLLRFCFYKDIETLQRLESYLLSAENESDRIDKK